MYIGKLNDRLPTLEWRATNASNAEILYCEEGNPFLGERFSVSWRELVPAGLVLSFRFTGNVLLNNIVLRFGAKSEPLSVSLYTEDREILLDRYCGETGSPIRKKEIALSVEGQRNAFVLVIEADLSDVILEGIDLCGADLSEEGMNIYPTPREMSLDGESYPISDFNTVSAD